METRYKKIETHAGSIVRVTGRSGSYGPTSLVDIVSSERIDERLAEGWEIIESITHHSEKHDATAIFFVLGLPDRE